MKNEEWNDIKWLLLLILKISIIGIVTDTIFELIVITFWLLN